LGAVGLVAAPDTNITGKWTGSFSITGPDGSKDGNAVLMLKQTGNEVTGTVGPSEDEQYTIKTGKLDGDKITLLVEDEGRSIKFDLVLAADRITGDADLSHDGQTAKAKLDVTRAK
jgi:hypothetical protein